MLDQDLFRIFHQRFPNASENVLHFLIRHYCKIDSSDKVSLNQSNQLKEILQEASDDDLMSLYFRYLEKDLEGNDSSS